MCVVGEGGGGEIVLEDDAIELGRSLFGTFLTLTLEKLISTLGGTAIVHRGVCVCV